MKSTRRVSGRLRLGAALWLCAGACSGVLAQSAPAQPDTVIRSLIPAVISLQSPAQASIDFDITALNYPPATFPARYFSAAQTFAVLSSSGKPWTVQMQVTPSAGPSPLPRALPDLKGLFYRLNGGSWLPVAATPQVVLSGVAATLGWQPLKLEFALDLQGSEISQESFEVRFTATLLP
ncbi:hypothetical protein [Deinococcus alpinitundrae]|uniref:hypothetical protein n=1 Tax=Deinococcus alpinitundrae TaxID=468913 RepID=UPI00137AB6A9|nr:hypothetical protein [Deinococcus alpinitundrae]